MTRFGASCRVGRRVGPEIRLVVGRIVDAVDGTGRRGGERGGAGGAGRSRELGQICEKPHPKVRLVKWSGWRDLNSRPLRPERSALPSCATARCCFPATGDSLRICEGIATSACRDRCAVGEAGGTSVELGGYTGALCRARTGVHMRAASIVGATLLSATQKPAPAHACAPWAMRGSTPDIQVRMARTCAAKNKRTNTRT